MEVIKGHGGRTTSLRSFKVMEVVQGNSVGSEFGANIRTDGPTDICLCVFGFSFSYLLHIFTTKNELCRNVGLENYPLSPTKYRQSIQIPHLQFYILYCISKSVQQFTFTPSDRQTGGRTLLN